MNKHLGSSFESYLAQQPPTVWYLPKVDELAILTNDSIMIESEYLTNDGIMIESGYLYDWGITWLDILIDAGAVYIGEL
jgi:hypothetical protein